jgi:outer membrane lipoprotein-sorting protein
MPRLLFDALAPTKARLADGFAVADCEPADDEPTWRRLTLLPTAAKTKKIAAEITLLIDPKGPSLRGFGYQDPRGDDVRIELRNVQVAAEADDARFRLDLPADAKVMVHHVPAEPPGEAPAKDRAAKDPAAKDPAASDKAAPQPSRRG